MLQDLESSQQFFPQLAHAEDAVNGMSVDVEEYFQVKAMGDTIERRQWNSLPSRVEASVERILELFGDHDISATFFILGWIAEKHPGLVRAIVANGHEVASHGWEHTPADEQSREAFREDIMRAKKLLEDISSTAVIGYRAASFSINASNLWALEELENCGFRYSSSIYPVQHDIYGLPDAPRFAFRPDNAMTLIEWPGPTIEFAGRRWNCGGGGWFRIMPYTLFRWAVRRLHTVDRQPTFFYFHPWEIDPAQPRVRGLSAKSRLRHYTNLDRTESRLHRLLRDFHWDRFDRLLDVQ